MNRRLFILFKSSEILGIRKRAFFYEHRTGSASIKYGPIPGTNFSITKTIAAEEVCKFIAGNKWTEALN